MSDFPKREALILFQQRYYTYIHVQCNNITRYFRIISMKHPPPHSYSTAKYNIDILDVFLTDFNLKQNLIIRHQCQLSTLLCASLSAHVIQHKSIFHLSTPDTVFSSKIPVCMRSINPPIATLPYQPSQALLLSLTRTDM